MDIIIKYYRDNNKSKKVLGVKMSYYIGIILPNLSHDRIRYLSESLDIPLEKEEKSSKFFGADQCFYLCSLSGLGFDNGFSSYESCRQIEEFKNGIDNQPKDSKDYFLKKVYPVLEQRRADAENWVRIIHTCFKLLKIPKMGIVMFWCSNEIGEFDFSKIKYDETSLQKIDSETIMRFKVEVIHYIVQ